MSEQTLEEVELTIKWHMMDDNDNVIKFQDREVTYEVTDAVKEFIKNKNISQTAKVKVKIDPNASETEAGLVERIEVIEDNASAEQTQEPEPETTSENSETKGNVKRLTVNGVSVEKKGIIFKEEEKVWYTLSDNIDANNVKDMMTGKLVEVSIEKTDEGNDIIDSIELVPVSEEQSSNGYDQGKADSSIQSSIESQVALEHASLIVSKTVDKDTTPETIETRIRRLSEFNYQVIQDLKKK